MAFEGWVSFGGVELVNNARAAAYAAGSGITVARWWPDLPASLGDVPYTDPITDDASWVDTSRVESRAFYGLLGLELIGAGKASTARAWTELITDGGVPGAGRRGSKEIEVRAVAFAADQAALSYGLAWLASALRGSLCGTDCAGDELCVYAACPTRPLLPGTGGCDAQPLDPFWDPITGSENGPGGDQLLRRLFTTALVEGPEVTGITHVTGGLTANVQFTLRSGTPYWYCEPVFVLRGDGLTGTSQPDVYRDTIAGYDPWSWQLTCPEPVNCLDGDPFCSVSAAPPAAAPAPPDPCFPNNPANNRADIPGQPGQTHTFTAARVVFSVPRGTGADWLEKVPIIRLGTGSAPVQRLIVRWYDNPTEVPCGGNLDPCDACAEIQVPWVPRGSVLTLDGRTSRASLDCAGPGPELTAPRLYGPSGAAFRWPVFECSVALCCEVLVEAAAAPDSWMEIHMATRQDVI